MLDGIHAVRITLSDGKAACNTCHCLAQRMRCNRLLQNLSSPHKTAATAKAVAFAHVVILLSDIMGEPLQLLLLLQVVLYKEHL